MAEILGGAKGKGFTGSPAVEGLQPRPPHR